jgi:DNA modification methylase
MRSTGTAKDFLRRHKADDIASVQTDPPWEISGGGRFSETATYALEPADAIVDTLTEARDIMVPGGFLYSFAPAGEVLPDIMLGMRRNGWEFQRELCWEKGRNGLRAWQNAHEPILVYTNGPTRGYELSGRYRSILRYPRPAGRTAKPWQCYRAFLEMSTRPGELAVDPYCGTNPLKAACESLQPSRRWAATDILTEAEVAVSVSMAGGVLQQRRRRPKPVPGQVVLAGGNLEADA